MKKSTFFALACVSALALGLTACAGPTPTATESSSQPTATASTSTTATASTGATPEPEAEAAGVVVSVEGIAIVDAGGQTLAEFDYFGTDAVGAVAALTEAFGAEPVLTQGETKDREDTIDSFEWPGFELNDPSTPPSFPLTADFRVVVTAAEIGGVAVETSDAVSVGMPSADVEPLAYRTWVYDPEGAHELAYLSLEQRPVDGIDFAEYEPAALSLSITASSPDGAVTRIFAPSGNWGD